MCANVEGLWLIAIVTTDGSHRRKQIPNPEQSRPTSWRCPRIVSRISLFKEDMERAWRSNAASCATVTWSNKNKAPMAWIRPLMAGSSSKQISPRFNTQHWHLTSPVWLVPSVGKPGHSCTALIPLPGCQRDSRMVKMVGRHFSHSRWSLSY
jgi:hypothetical protein